MQHLEIVYSSPYDIIPTGDFNIDSGRILTVLNVIQLIKSPALVTDTPSTTIDHIFTTCAEMHYKSGLKPITLTDHYCTYTILALKSLVNIPKIVKFLHPISY